MLSALAITLVSVGIGVYAAMLVRKEMAAGRMASPLCLVAGLFILHFSIPGIALAASPDLLVIEQNEPYILFSQLFALLCLATFHAAGRSFQGATPKAFVQGETEWGEGRLLLICAILLGIGWADRVYIVVSDGYFQIQRAVQGELEGPFYAAIRMAEAFPQAAVFLVLIHLFRMNDGELRRSRWIRIVLFLWVAELIYWLPTGRKEEVVQLLVMPFLIYNVARRQLPKFRHLAIVGLLVVALFPISYFYRAAWSEGDVSSGSLLDVVRESASDVGHRNYESGLSSGQIIFNRLSLIEPVASCVRLIDEGIWTPFWGISYGDAIVGAIPRFIWSGKPDFHYGTTFGQDAGYIASSDNVTSISVTYVGEAYLNFGVFGEIVFALLAVIYWALYRRAARSPYQGTWCFLYVTTLPVILYAGGTFALYFGGLLKLLPMYYLMGRFASVGRSRALSRAGRTVALMVNGKAGY